LSSLIAQIDAVRQSTNLSSAIRLFVLRYYRHQLQLRGGIVMSLGPSNSEDGAQIKIWFQPGLKVFFRIPGRSCMAKR